MTRPPEQQAGVQTESRRPAYSTRPPPHDADVEAALLGEILASAENGRPDALRAALEVGLTPSDFYGEAHRCVFAAMTKLHELGHPLSIAGLSGVLNATRPDLSAAHLLGLESAGTGGGDPYVRSHARRLVEVARLRRAEVLGRVVQQHALDGDLEGLAEAIKRLRHIELQGDDHRGSVTITLGTVTPERVKWLWPGWLPKGKLVLLDGDPGRGKSTLLLDVIARVTTGTPFPGEPSRERREPGTALLLTAEDDLADTVVPRLLAAGADLARVTSLNATREGGVERPVMIPEDVGVIRAAILERQAVIVVIDPVSAFFGPNVNPWRDSDVRRALRPLAITAAETGAVIIMIRHLVKGRRDNAMHKGGGSIAFTAAARAVHLVADDPDDDRVRVLAPVKNNLAPMPASLRFQLAPVPEHECARVTWVGTSQHTADHLVSDADQREARSARAEAGEWLTDQLAGGPAPVTALRRAAETDGLAWRTLERAKAKLGVRAVKAAKAGWSWQLPATPPPHSGGNRGGLDGLGGVEGGQGRQESQGRQECQEGDLDPLPSPAGNSSPEPLNKTSQPGSPGAPRRNPSLGPPPTREEFLRSIGYSSDEEGDK